MCHCDAWHLMVILNLNFKTNKQFDQRSASLNLVWDLTWDYKQLNWSQKIITYILLMIISQMTSTTVHRCPLIFTTGSDPVLPINRITLYYLLITINLISKLIEPFSKLISDRTGEADNVFFANRRTNTRWRDCLSSVRIPFRSTLNRLGGIIL